MRKYKYRAVDAKDEVHTGIIKAANYQDFLAKIYKLRLFPIEVVLAGATDDKLEHLKKIKNKLEHRIEKPFELPEEPPKQKMFSNVDWYYLAVVLAILGLVIASTQVNL